MRSYHMYMVKWSFFVLSNQKNEKLPNGLGKVVFLHVAQLKQIPKSRRHLADDILSKIMFDENLAICQDGLEGSDTY